MSFRSLLYVPANSERFIAKAHERGADAIILDLEDAVLPADKLTARENLAAAIPSVARNGAKVFVRINADPALQADDAIAACRAGAYGLYLAKARSPSAIDALATRLEPVEASLNRPPLRFVALIEDPGAVLDARDIAKAPRVMALSVGGEDLALELGAEPTPDVLRFPKLLVHYAAKAEGKLSFGLMRSVADYANLEAVRAAALEARTHGFDGASCVHPSAVPILNEAFAPSAEERAWAREVIAVADKTPAGAFALHGRMIDAPVVTRARRILGGD